jgi:hypothetical protein
LIRIFFFKSFEHPLSFSNFFQDPLASFHLVKFSQFTQESFHRFQILILNFFRLLIFVFHLKIFTKSKLLKSFSRFTISFKPLKDCLVNFEFFFKSFQPSFSTA